MDFLTLRFAAAAAASAGMGLSLGLLGGGGSILAVPVLIYIAGVRPSEAIPMSLAMVGATALLGGLRHGQAGQVDWKIAATFGGAGIAGALAGSRLSHLLSDRSLLLAFAALMLIVGALMLRGRRGAEAASGTPKRWVAPAVGFGVGALTGFLGVGGGFVIVPALLFSARLGMRRAIGTSLIIISVNCAAGLVGHLRHVRLESWLALGLTAASISGALFGERLARHAPPAALRRGFGLFVIVLGLYVGLRSGG